MAERIPQSTAKTVLFKAYLASDHVTEATGKTIAITISKNGGAFGNPNAGATNATEISSGWYKVALDTTDTGTTGPLAVRGAVALVDDVGVLFEVVSATSGGYTNLDAAVSSRMATYTQPTGFLTATFPATPAATGDAMTLTSGERNSVADALLNRDLSTGSDSGSTTVRTVRQALRFLRNKWAIVAGTLTVYKEDDATASWTATVGTTAGVDPVTSNDPAGP